VKIAITRAESFEKEVCDMSAGMERDDSNFDSERELSLYKEVFLWQRRFCFRDI
jgi:hypothetical protein